jgi:hypothetical protein
MSGKKPPQMATTTARPAPVRTAPEAEPPKNRGRFATIKHVVKRIEDRVDYLTVRQARASAAKRGEKSVAWEEFRKKLG